VKRKVSAGTSRWTIDAYATDGGNKPVWAFVQGLEGNDKVEALGDGLFELRGKQVRLFYAFLPGRVIVLLDGEIKKRDGIPVRTLERMRVLQAEVMRCATTQGGRRKSR